MAIAQKLVAQSQQAQLALTLRLTDGRTSVELVPNTPKLARIEGAAMLFESLDPR